MTRKEVIFWNNGVVEEKCQKPCVQLFAAKSLRLCNYWAIVVACISKIALSFYVSSALQWQEFNGHGLEFQFLTNKNVLLSVSVVALHGAYCISTKTSFVALLWEKLRILWGLLTLSCNVSTKRFLWDMVKLVDPVTSQHKGLAFNISSH